MRQCIQYLVGSRDIQVSSFPFPHISNDKLAEILMIKWWGGLVGLIGSLYKPGFEALQGLGLRGWGVSMKGYCTPGSSEA